MTVGFRDLGADAKCLNNKRQAPLFGAKRTRPRPPCAATVREATVVFRDFPEFVPNGGAGHPLGYKMRARGRIGHYYCDRNRGAARASRGSRRAYLLGRDAVCGRWKGRAGLDRCPHWPGFCCPFRHGAFRPRLRIF